MITGVFVITTVISCFGWLNYWVGVAALSKYMADKGYMPPSNEEMKTCCSYVLKKLFRVH